MHNCDWIIHICLHEKWLGIVSIAIMYNYIFIVGRTVFWDMQNLCPIVWLVLDYICDLIYVFDMAVHAHEGVSSTFAFSVLIINLCLGVKRRVSRARSHGDRATKIATSLLAKLGLEN